MVAIAVDEVQNKRTAEGWEIEKRSRIQAACEAVETKMCTELEGWSTSEDEEIAKSSTSSFTVDQRKGGEVPGVIQEQYIYDAKSTIERANPNRQDRPEYRTTWEMNFEQVESNPEDARGLILMFCYLDAAKIPEAMLDRACSLQRRWSHSGEVTKEAPSASGVDGDLIQTVKDELRFDDAVEILKPYSLIYVNEDKHTSLRNFSIYPLVQYCASQRVPVDVQNYWRKQAIALICHALPRDEVSEPL